VASVGEVGRLRSNRPTRHITDGVHLLTLDRTRDSGRQDRPVKAHRCAASELSAETLAAALQRRELQAYYQPSVSCASRALVGFEAMARWRHPDLGLITPDQFTPVAERSGLIGRLTRQVIENALSWFAKSFGDTPATITLNLSATLLSDPQLPGWLFESCSRFAIDPGQVVLAITETDAMAHQVRIARVAMQLRIYGFRFCISNFGVGYSSLLQLAQLPFSELKVDRRFVTSAADSEKSREVITNVIGLSRAVDLKVTADGVADVWTLDFLNRRGCHAAQGLLIAPPMDAAAALAWRGSHDRGGPSKPS
jgi:EAL domain-containing protein (putative c-di-GMP-specific phosphodiesterase class I)